jgi:hypothetical protein
MEPVTRFINQANVTVILYSSTMPLHQSGTSPPTFGSSLTETPYLNDDMSTTTYVRYQRETPDHYPWI